MISILPQVNTIYVSFAQHMVWNDVSTRVCPSLLITTVHTVYEISIKKKFNSIFTWLSFNGKKNTPIICFSATKTKILVSIFLLYKIIFLKSSMNSKWNAKFRWIYTKEDSTTCAFPPTNILSLSLSLLINYFFDKRKIHIYLVEGPFKQST